MPKAVFVVSLVLTLAVAAAGQQSPSQSTAVGTQEKSLATSPQEAAAQARTELNLGVQAFKEAKYNEASEHFQRAATLDPGLTTARLYLGTTYMQQWTPGMDTPENNHFADLAVEEFSKVLQLPGVATSAKLHSLKSLASIHYNRKEFQESNRFYRQCIELDPSDPENYYMVGVNDWAEVYKAAALAKAKIGLKVDEEYGSSETQKRTCREQQSRNSPVASEGIDALNKALKLRADYEDAMAYMNLLYRLRADLHCGDPRAHAADIDTANEWVDKTLATRNAKQKSGKE